MRSGECRSDENFLKLRGGDSYFHHPTDADRLVYRRAIFRAIISNILDSYIEYYDSRI